MHRTTIAMGDELAAAVRASGLPLAELVRRGLEASTPDRETVRRTAAFLARVAGQLADGWRLIPPEADA